MSVTVSNKAEYVCLVIYYITMRMTKYPLLAPFEQDLLSASASESYVKRVFSKS